jgi:hypothetical protein
VTVAAEQAGDATYAPVSLSRSFAVRKLAQTIAFAPIPAQPRTNTVGLAAAASSGLPVTFAVVSGPGVLAGGTNLSFTATGTVAVAASQPGDATWEAAATATNLVLVTDTVPYMPGDFDGDRATDLNVYFDDPYRQYWYSLSLDSRVLAWEEAWGGTTNRNPFTTLRGDYDGDRISDLAVYDHVNGFWYVRTLDERVLVWEQPWGGAGFLPVAGDFDADGIWDLAVYHEATGEWFVRGADGTVLAYGLAWGGPGFRPLTGDADGDGAYDLILNYYLGAPYWVYWYGYSLARNEALFWEKPWGHVGWIPVEGDYDGDGLGDLGVYNPETGDWHVADWAYTHAIVWYVPFGGPGYTPVPGDYDGDRIWDLAVYEQATGLWYVRTVSGTVLLWASPLGGPGFAPLR